jgi:hypothetical protein
LSNISFLTHDFHREAMTEILRLGPNTPNGEGVSGGGGRGGEARKRPYHNKVKRGREQTHSTSALNPKSTLYNFCGYLYIIIYTKIYIEYLSKTQDDRITYSQL